MKKPEFTKYVLSGLAVVLIASCEFLPHPMNFVPVTAAAIFSGLYITKRYAVVLPLLSLFVADIIQGISWIDVPFVYGSVALATLLGGWLANSRSKGRSFVPKLFGITIASSVIFFIVTNFGVWLFQTMYTKDVHGLLQCYIMAVPFFRNALLGDVVFTMAFVGCYESLAWGLETWSASRVSDRAL